MCFRNSRVVINRKTTKFESNSQRKVSCGNFNISCYQSQNYKIWKQFTTCWCSEAIRFWLLSIAKLQNLKAIHNIFYQQVYRSSVVINRKTTKFESNSQRLNRLWQYWISCYQSQNYKIWKQFTTEFCPYPNYFQLLSIAKLQNLKAIHN